MAFMGKRQGHNVSRHLQLKSVAFIRCKLDRLPRGRKLTPGENGILQVCIGILKSRGERID